MRSLLFLLTALTVSLVTPSVSCAQSIPAITTVADLEQTIHLREWQLSKMVELNELLKAKDSNSAFSSFVVPSGNGEITIGANDINGLKPSVTIVFRNMLSPYLEMLAKTCGFGSKNELISGMKSIGFYKIVVKTPRESYTYTLDSLVSSPY